MRIVSVIVAAFGLATFSALMNLAFAGSDDQAWVGMLYISAFAAMTLAVAWSLWNRRPGLAVGFALWLLLLNSVFWFMMSMWFPATFAALFGSVGAALVHRYRSSPERRAAAAQADDRPRVIRSPAPPTTRLPDR